MYSSTWKVKRHHKKFELFPINPPGFHLHTMFAFFQMCFYYKIATLCSVLKTQNILKLGAKKIIWLMTKCYLTSHSLFTWNRHIFGQIEKLPFQFLFSNSQKFVSVKNSYFVVCKSLFSQILRSFCFFFFCFLRAILYFETMKTSWLFRSIHESLFFNFRDFFGLSETFECKFSPFSYN